MFHIKLLQFTTLYNSESSNYESKHFQYKVEKKIHVDCAMFSSFYLDQVKFSIRTLDPEHEFRVCLVVQCSSQFQFLGAVCSGHHGEGKEAGENLTDVWLGLLRVIDKDTGQDRPKGLILWDRRNCCHDNVNQRLIFIIHFQYKGSLQIKCQTRIL